MMSSTVPTPDAQAAQDTPATPDAQAAWDLLGAKPGKVVAMHIGYASRAAQRGRTPEAPGYFLKPATSLSTGGDVVRPAGAEILGFEGEIALVIGRTARRVDQAEAWSHVSAVTAANDLGVFDFRWADKGANVRSKGGDGYTPLGPTLLPAADVDPERIELRTWLNGELVQSDDTSTLIFPLAQIVSDLSQLLTLEVGDVILTGTPAGATTFEPGDVVEVEVRAGELSTGRLRTTAVPGAHPVPAYSAQPKPTPEQWADASGRPLTDFAGEPAPAPVLTEEVREQLSSVAVATLSSVLRAKGLVQVTIDGVRPLAPGQRLLGTARTLRYIPFREDLFKSHGGGYNAQKRAVDSLQPGEVLVMEARGESRAGTLGDIIALRAHTLGAAGIITDGGVRDAEVVAGVGLPVYFSGAHPSVLGRFHVPWAVDETIACGGASVQPGDVLVGDADGVVVIPPGLVAEVAAAAVAQEAQEEFIAEMVREGHPVDGLFPMNAEWRARYEASR